MAGIHTQREEAPVKGEIIAKPCQWLTLHVRIMAYLLVMVHSSISFVTYTSRRYFDKDAGLIFAKV